MERGWPRQVLPSEIWSL